MFPTWIYHLLTRSSTKVGGNDETENLISSVHISYSEASLFGRLSATSDFNFLSNFNSLDRCFIPIFTVQSEYGIYAYNGADRETADCYRLLKRSRVLLNLWIFFFPLYFTLLLNLTANLELTRKRKKITYCGQEIGKFEFNRRHWKTFTFFLAFKKK